MLPFIGKGMYTVGIGPGVRVYGEMVRFRLEFGSSALLQHHPRNVEG